MNLNYWIEVIVNGNAPSGRFYHGATVSKEQEEMWVLGGRVNNFRYNQIKLVKIKVFTY